MPRSTSPVASATSAWAIVRSAARAGSRSAGACSDRVARGCSANSRSEVAPPQVPRRTSTACVPAPSQSPVLTLDGHLPGPEARTGGVGPPGTAIHPHHGGTDIVDDQLATALARGHRRLQHAHAGDPVAGRHQQAAAGDLERAVVPRRRSGGAFAAIPDNAASRSRWGNRPTLPTSCAAVRQPVRAGNSASSAASPRRRAMASSASSTPSATCQGSDRTPAGGAVSASRRSSQGRGSRDDSSSAGNRATAAAASSAGHSSSGWRAADSSKVRVASRARSSWPCSQDSKAIRNRSSTGRRAPAGRSSARSAAAASPASSADIAAAAVALRPGPTAGSPPAQAASRASDASSKHRSRSHAVITAVLPFPACLPGSCARPPSPAAGSGAGPRPAPPGTPGRRRIHRAGRGGG